MTAILPCNQAGLPATQEPLQVSPGMTMFLADELLPLMAGLWPASANQLDGNARGVAMAWGLQLRGMTAEQISEAVLALATDTARQFAPRPAEVRAAAMALLAPVQSAAPIGQTISVRACEMIAEARVFMRCGAVLPGQLQGEIAAVMGEMRQRGAVISGRVM
jgi:hypothetical protein